MITDSEWHEFVKSITVLVLTVESIPICRGKFFSPFYLSNLDLQKSLIFCWHYFKFKVNDCLVGDSDLMNGTKIVVFSPCHIELILSEKQDVVSKPTDIALKAKKESKKKQKRQLARGEF